MISSKYQVETDNVTETAWAELLALFADSSLYQTHSIGCLQVGERKLSRLIVRKDGEVVAMAQVAIRKIPVLAAGIATLYWGPMWRRKGSPADPAVLDRVIESLKDEYVIRRGLLLRIWPVAFEASEVAHDTVQVLNHHGFARDSSIRPYRTLLLSLDGSLDDLRQNLSPKWRNQLKTAEKSNLQLSTGTSGSMYLEFLAMLKEMLERKKFSSNMDYDSYGQIQSDLPEHLKMTIVVCASAGAPVASGVFSAIGDTGTYVFGATAQRGLGLNGANLVHWTTIEWLKNRGCQWYDLGGIDPVANPGVYHFKRGIAGKRGIDTTHLGQFYVATNPVSSFINACINRLNDAKSRIASVRARTLSRLVKVHRRQGDQ